MTYIIDIDKAARYNSRKIDAGQLTGHDIAKLAAAYQKLRKLGLDGMVGQGGETLEDAERLVTMARVIPWPTPPVVDYADGVYPMVDNGGHPFRVTSGYMWPERTKSSGPHPGVDLCQRLAGRFPESDGIFGAANGTKCCASWAGTVIDAERDGAYWSVSVWHKVRMPDGNVIDLIAYYLHVLSELQTADAFGQELEAGEIFCAMRTVPNRLNHLHYSHHDCHPLDWTGAADWGQNKRTSIPVGGPDYGATRTEPGTDAWRMHEGVLADWRRISE